MTAAAASEAEFFFSCNEEKEKRWAPAPQALKTTRVCASVCLCAQVHSDSSTVSPGFAKPRRRGPDYNDLADEGVQRPCVHVCASVQDATSPQY